MDDCISVCIVQISANIIFLDGDVATGLGYSWTV